MATGAQLSGRETYSFDTDDPFGKKFSFGHTKDLSPKFSKYKDKIIDRLAKPKDSIASIRASKASNLSPAKSKNILKSSSSPFLPDGTKHRFGKSPSPLPGTPGVPNLDIKEVYRQKYSYNKPNDPFDSKGLPRAKTLASFRQSTYRGNDETQNTNVFDQSLCNDLQRLLEEDINPRKIEKKRAEWNTRKSEIKKVIEDKEFRGSFNRGKMGHSASRPKERSPFTRTGMLRKDPLPNVPLNRKAVTPTRSPTRGIQGQGLSRLINDSDPVH